MFLSVIKQGEEDWAVWVALEDGHPYRNQPNGFVIGMGATKADAIIDAVKELKDAAQLSILHPEKIQEYLEV